MRRIAIVIVAAAILAGVAGCQEKFTRQRYETIYIGQPEFEVEKTLGEPTAKFSDTWTYIHDKPFYKAIVEFDSGRVTDKTWYDEREMGTHPDMDDATGRRQVEVQQKTKTK